MAITTDIDKIRLEIGDTDESAVLFYDDELQYFLDGRSGVILLAAADACDALARKFAREFDFKTDDQEFKKGARAKVWADLAKDLRARAGGGLSSLTVTRVDGYSDDLSTRDGAGQTSSARGRIRRGYTDPDLPS